MTIDHFPLEYFRQEMSIHPFRFYQLGDESGSGNDTMFFQHAWQFEDRIGREDMQRALDETVAKLTEHLHYSPWQHFTEETLQWPHYQEIGIARYPFLDARQRWTSVKLSEGYVQSVGTEALSLIDDAVAVVYSDADGDNVTDTFTATVATSVTDASQIAAYFAPGDRLNDDLGDWRIQPVRVTIAGGNATIKGPAWLLVLPALYEGVAPQPLDAADAGNFASELAVYWRSTYTAGTAFDDAQATLIYETRPAPWWGCVQSPTQGSTDPATSGYAIARADIRDAKLGYVSPAKVVYDATTGVWSSDLINTAWFEPDRVTVRYRAGYPLNSSGQLDTTMRQLVCRMGAAEMGRDIPALQGTNREIARWQFDLARSAGDNDEAYLISPDELTNPLGTRRGHVWAWRTIKRLAQMGAVLP